MSNDNLSNEVLDLLRKFDTPTVCNVIEVFDVRPRHAGYMDSRIKACFPEMPPMVGFAATATFRSADPPRGGDVYTGLDQQLETFSTIPGPPVVVFQDLDSPARSATFGEVMCSTYKEFGAAGLITSGAARDLDQVRAIGFPAFSDGTICAHGYCHTLSTNIPVHVGGITIYPGDLIHGDCNGVTTIPVDIASEVAHACQPFMDAEDAVLDYVRSGSPNVAGFAEARGKLMAMVAEIKAGLGR
jgi:4-hydroxy-4-methyl-2-oxoglutarate aldolase